MNNLGGEKGILGQRRAGAGCAVHASKALNSDQAVMKPFPRQWLAAGRTLGCLSVTSFLEQMRQMKVTETVHALVPAKKKKKKNKQSRSEGSNYYALKYRVHTTIHLCRVQWSLHCSNYAGTDKTDTCFDLDKRI